MANFKLDAAAVLLLACSSAALLGVPETGRQLGLAEAFLRAGSRSVLGTYWKTFSEVVLDLVAKMFGQIAEDPSIDLAEAMRRAQIELLLQTDKPFRAHPTIWAPFVILGDGGSLLKTSR